MDSQEQNQISDCPSVEQLEAFSMGRLSFGDVDTVATHLERCLPCQSTLSALTDSADSILSELRRAKSAEPFVTEPECDDAIALAKAVGLARIEPTASAGFAALQDHTPDNSLGLRPIREYQPIAELGRGGMGVVYKALHRKLKRIVALKVLPAERTNDPASTSRFYREMEAVGNLDHPNIIRATDAGDSDGTHFLAMEYFEGIDLGKLVARHGPLPVADACEVVRQAALGLQHAHEHGLVHRDVKPSNLLLTPTGIVKVLDLGLARLYGEQPSDKELTSSGQILGTPDYMAPEQIENIRGVDIRVDVYALGCTLYKLLAGHAPFSGPQFQSAFQKLLGHRQEPVPSIHHGRPDVSPPLAVVIARMLEKDAAKRYGTPAEVAAALAPFTGESDLAGLMQTANSNDGGSRHRSSSFARSNPLLIDRTPRLWNRPRPTDPMAKHARRWPVRIKIGAGLAVAIAFLVVMQAFGGMIIRIATNKGQLIVEVDDAAAPDVVVEVRGSAEPVRISSKSGWRVDLKAGTYEVAVTGGSDLVSLSRDTVTVTRGGEEIVKARFKSAIADTSALPKPTMPVGQATVDSDTAVAMQAAAAGLPSLGTWKAGSGSNVLPGLIESPAALPGIKRWNVETMQQRHASNKVAWSPDGKWLASLSALGPYIRIYNGATGSLDRMLHNSVPARSLSHSLTWSSDARYVATLTNLGRINVFEVESARHVHLFDKFKGSFSHVAWSPDGRWMAAGTAHGDVRLWDCKDEALGHVFKGHEGEILDLAWSTDSRWLASASEDKTVRLWDVPHDAAGAVLTAHENAVVSVGWSPDGNHLASAGADATVRVWDAKDGQPGLILTRQVYRKGGSEGAAVAWSPDGRWLASGMVGGGMQLWHADDYSEGFKQEIWGQTSLAWSPDSKWLAAGGKFKQDAVQVWDVVHGKLDRTTGYESALNVGFAWNPQGRQFAYRGNGMVCLWDATHMQQQHLFGTDILAAEWDPSGQRLATGGADGFIRFWNATTGKEVQSFRAHTQPILSIAWSPDGSRMISCASTDHVLRVWTTDSTPHTVLSIPYRSPGSVTWSPDGIQIASQILFSQRGNISLWDARTGAGGAVIDIPGLIELAWDPAGKRLASARFGDPCVQLWDSRTGNEITTPLSGNSMLGDSPKLDWSPDGKRIAYAGGYVENHLFVNDATDGKLEQKWMLSGVYRTRDLAWAPDSRQLAWCCVDNTLRIWDADTARLRTLAIFFPGGRAAAFNAAGELLYCDSEAEKQLVYLVEARTVPPRCSPLRTSCAA